MAFVRFTVFTLSFALLTLLGRGAEAAPSAAPAPEAHYAASQATPGAPGTDSAQQARADEETRATNTGVAAAVTVVKPSPKDQLPAMLRPTDFLEHLVDITLEMFGIENSGNTPAHWAIAAFFVAASLLLRRVVTKILFGFFRRWAAKTKTTLDDKLFPALEQPVNALIGVTGILAALKVLKLSVVGDEVVAYGSIFAYSLAVFWLFLCAFNAVLDHAHELAREKELGIAAFMPWIKKTLVALFVIFGALLIAQNLGADVKAFLTGLGIGGLAFALAAQDTLANVFGSVVVAIDQPFKVGEAVKIGDETGTVEDIGLRSTRIRKPDRSLVVIPNKSVASANVVNLSRFTGRRVEQLLGLSYDAKPEQLAGLVEDLRKLIAADPEVDPKSVLVFFRDFNASSLDVWLAYQIPSPDNERHLATRQRLNLAFMHAITARGLTFAFPSQTVYLDGEPLRQIAAASGKKDSA